MMPTDQATTGEDTMESQTQPATLTIDRIEPNGHGAIEQTTFGQLVDGPSSARRRGRIDGVIVWLIVSVAFLGYLAFGSFSVQVWRYSDFLSEYYPIRVPRRILHIWIYQGRQLPEVRFQIVLVIIYYASLFVCVAGAIYGLRLLLDRAGTGSARHPIAERRPPRIEG